jgi:serine O-acetyltransferase
MFRAVREQIETVFRGDPAAKSAVEIFFCYPGFHAILLHRVAHKLYASFPLLARIVSQFNRMMTGIEIHPGAAIGRRCFIDHGMGVVIGETTEIGDDVLLYQGVTLGGTGKEKGKRHPTIGSNIMIGDHTKIGAGSVVIRSVPDHSTVVGVPGRVVRSGADIGDLEHGTLPDPEGQLIDDLAKRIDQLEAQIKLLAEERLAERR